MSDPLAIFDGVPPTATQPAATGPAKYDMSIFDGVPVTSAPAQTEVAPPAPTTAQPSRAETALRQMKGALGQWDQNGSVAAGMDRGLRDVVDRPASWLAHGADTLGATAGEGQRVDDMNTAARTAFDAKYGDDTLAGAARVGGQVALTIPIGGAIGKLAGAGADMLAAGAGRVSPLLGNIVQGTTDFLSGNAGGPGVLPRLIQGASTAASGALQGGTAAGLTAGQSDAPLVDQALQGAAVGAVVAPVARTVAGTAGAVKNAVLGSAADVNPEVAALARTAQDKYGIKLTGDMITPSPFARTMGSQLEQVPLSGMAAAKQDASRQFTRAVAKTIGEDSEYVTPSVMERAKNRIGDVMNSVADRTGVPVDQQLQSDLTQIANEATSALPQSERPLLMKQISDILSLAGGNSGVIPGEAYQTLTGYRSGIATSMRAGTPTMQDFSGRLRAALDNGLERAAVASGDTSAIDQLREARLQYKNMMTIKPLVTKGEPGEIAPNRLLGVVDKSFKNRGLRADQPDLGELADIGQRFNLVPDSKTTSRAATMAALTTLGGSAAQLMAGQPMNALYTASSIPATMAGGRLASAYLRSPAYINSLLGSTAIPAVSQTSPLLQYGVPLSVIGQGRVMGR